MSGNSKFAADSTNRGSNARQRTNRRRGSNRSYAVMLAAAAVPMALQARNAFADIFGFGDGTSSTGWQLNGSAVATPPATGTAVTDLQMTPALNGQAGSAFYDQAQRVDNFTASFHYAALNGSGNPADGVTFVLQNDARTQFALGDGGGNLGYGGGAAIQNSVAFEINIYAPQGRGTTVQANGGTGGYAPAGGIDFLNPDGVNITLQYNGAFLKETLTQGTN